MNRVILGLLLIFQVINAQNIITCNENRKFKKKFFKNIERVRYRYIILKRNEFDKRAQKSLRFINKYVLVLNVNVSGYSPRTALIFNENFENWIKWYEKHKCSNIQFKKKSDRLYYLDSIGSVNYQEDLKVKEELKYWGE